MVPVGVGAKAEGMRLMAAAAMRPMTVRRRVLKMTSKGGLSLWARSQRPTMRMSVMGRMRTAREAMSAPATATAVG